MSTNVDLIKEKFDLVDYVSRSMQLKRVGQNFMGLCPFHKESTPSFHISPQRQRWHCFGCNKGGDVITFVMEKENLDFWDALTVLAKEAGVELNKTHTESKSNLTDILDRTQEFYLNQLNSQQGKTAIEYLINTRKIPEQLVHKFQLGYAPHSWDQTGKYLLSQGYTLKDITESGLVIPKEDNRWYDRFRHRVMFPIFDHLNRIVGFSGRVFEGSDKEAKYINSPETPLFKKSHLLYGLSLAKESVVKHNYLVLVEGQLDVIALHSIGITNSAAPLGTAFTPSHVQIIKKFTSRVILCFDGDSAGQTATYRTLQILLAGEVDVKVVQLTGGKDPDEAIHTNPDQLKKDLKNSSSVLEFLLQEARKSSTPTTFADSVSKTILPVIKLIPNEIKQETLIQKLAQDTGISARSLLNEFAKLSPAITNSTVTVPKVNPQKNIPLPKSTVNRYKNLWEELLSAILQSPSNFIQEAEVLVRLEDLLPKSNASSSVLYNLANKLINQILQLKPIDSNTIDPILNNEEKELLNLLALRSLGKIGDNRQEWINYINSIIYEIKVLQIKSKINTLSKNPNSTPNEKQTVLQSLTEELRKLQLEKKNRN